MCDVSVYFDDFATSINDCLQALFFEFVFYCKREELYSILKYEYTSVYSHD